MHTNTGEALSLEQVSALGREDFVSRFGAVFEHSPWVAEEAWKVRPFASLDEFHGAMTDAVARAARSSQIALLNAHPELAGQEALEGALTPDSSTEQSRLGFTALSRADHQRMAQLNTAYRGKFGFPAIVALAFHASRDTVFAEIERRVRNDMETEISEALAQVAKITRARLVKIVSVH